MKHSYNFINEFKSDYQETGKLYPKLDSYRVLEDPKGFLDYMGSSCQFKTKKKFKAWLLCFPEYQGLNIKIIKVK